MKVSYYINRAGAGVITSGTPCRIVPGVPLELYFGTEYDGAECIVNCRRYTVKDGGCTIPAASISPLLEICLQQTKCYPNSSVTQTVFCETLMEIGGELVGLTENTDYTVHLRHFAAIKHTVMNADREIAQLTAQVAALEAKYAELEEKLNGTDIFALRETIEETENAEETEEI